MTVEIIGLRTVCVVIRNADALNPVQRMTRAAKRISEMIFTSPNCMASRSQAAGREFHQRALRFKGEIILGRQGHARGFGFMLQLVNGPAERRSERFAGNGIGARVGIGAIG